MTSRYDPAFDRAVMASENVDMIGDSRMAYDGPRCIADDCDTPVDHDGDMCEPCADAPHQFIHDGDRRFPDWCRCGRIRAIRGHSPVHTDVLEGAATGDAMTVRARDYRRPGQVFL